jgi:uncharacterized protein YkwD
VSDRLRYSPAMVRAALPAWVVGALLIATMAAPSATAQPTAAEAALIRAINAERAPHGLAPLRVDVRLERAARAKSSEMLRTGTFAHGDLRGRLVRYRVSASTFGENLAWATGSSASATRIVQRWMASPGHRANILRPAFTRIGIGRRVGTFAGHRNAAVVTADFAG